jgi:hypothetical protein
MILFTSILALVLAAASLVTAHSFRHAPIGVEDSAGFHRDTR